MTGNFTRVEPLWFRMLRKWKDEQSNRTGLTLPFLIGAAMRESIEPRVLDEDEAFGELAGLLTTMWHEVPPEYVVRIGHCDKVKAPVAGIYRASDLRGFARAVLVPHPKTTRKRGDLYAEVEYFAGKRRNLDALSKGLEAVVGSAIRSGKLSRNAGSDVFYDDGDKDFIARVRAHVTSSGQGR
jgi:hypothetical protein